MVDLIIKIEENNIIKNHCFESVENIDYLKQLQIGKELNKKGISQYLYYKNNDLKEKGIDLEYIVDINPEEDVTVKSKRISKESIEIQIDIRKLDLQCNEIIIIPQK